MELLVATVIGLFIVGAMVTVMANSRRAYEEQDYAADMQESARFAMYALSRELRMAGYYGCSNHLVNSLSGVLDNTTGRVSGVNGSTSGAPDEFTVRYADPSHADIALASFGSATQWTLNRVPQAWEDDLADAKPVYVLISDCGSTAIAALTGANAKGGTIRLDTSKLGRTFDPDSGLSINVRRLRVHTYSIGTDAQGIPSLMIDENLGDGPQVLIEGIENMQVIYRALGAVGPGPMANWNDVTSINIGLLVRSISEYRPHLDRSAARNLDHSTHTVLDVTFEPQERGGTLPPLHGRRGTYATATMLRNNI